MQFICPECKTILLKTTEDCGYSCTTCGLFYPIVNGIPSFLNEKDDFYEGKFVATKKRYVFWPIKLFLFIYHAISISSSRERFIKKAFRKVLPDLNKSNGIRILDLGCGGGVGGVD